MRLTIEQAAQALGKSTRQVRYLIQQGKLPATKVAGRWQIDSNQLPQTRGQAVAAERKQEQLIAAVEDTLDLPPRAKRRRYSLKDLRAFQIAKPLYCRAAAELGCDHPASRALRRALEQLARGCHRYANHDKATAYSDARDAASEAACELDLSEHPIAGELLEEIEQELMAAIAGLLRRLDRLARRDLVA